MEIEQQNKVVRLNENLMRNEAEVEDGERDDKELSPMDKLPNEILMKILDYLKEQELVKCRLLSSRWNEISCLLLQDKSKKNPYSKHVVQLKKNMECTTVITKSLNAFLNCFSPSKAEKTSPHRPRPFPFSRFHFQTLKHLDLAQICDFVSTFGPHMKTVFVDMDSKDNAKVEKFWRLLLHFAPDIHILRIVGDSSLTKVVLMDPITKFIAKTDPNFKPPNNAFVNVKILEIMSKNFGQFNVFMKDLLETTPNLEQVSCLNPNSPNCNHQLDSLEVWQQLEKAHLVKKLLLQPITRSDFPPPAQILKNLRLEHLTAYCCFHPNPVENSKTKSSYIHHALKSNAETLSSLNLCNFSSESVNFYFKDIKSLPNVRQLEIQMQDVMENEIILHRISQLCPNIKIIHVRFLGNNVSQVTPILWTKFQRLTSLKITLNMPRKNNSPLIVDAAFSGYSQESIQKILSKLELDKEVSLEEARRSEQQNPSILDLKDLCRLELEFFMGKKSAERKKVEHQLRSFAVFMKLLPQHIREHPRSIIFHYF